MSEADDWQECVTPEGHRYYFNPKTEESSWDMPAVLRKRRASSAADSMVWVPHPEEGYIQGRVSRECGDGTCEVTTSEGEGISSLGKTLFLKMAPSKFDKVIPTSLDKNVDDLVQMEDINEAMIVHNLRKRFKNEQIYTNIGTILISVNPFKRLPLYTPTVMDQYMHKGIKEMPPHTFNIADNAYKAMIENKKNQSILISGESGAGKTECTKQCLMYFAELAGSVTGVEQFILLANPILEAFGNAKTLRNNNSSRFGKWVEIHFDTSARICGACTVNYLLEKSRVVYQLKGERNFHIFYQLVAGADQERKAKWHLQSADSYNYLNKSGCITIDGVDDAKEFEEVKEAMVKLSFKEEEMDNVLQLTAAILHLGNVMFEPEMTKNGPDTSKAQIVNPDTVKIVAELLGADVTALEASLIYRTMEIRGCAPTKIPLTPDQARDTCDALAKALYGRMFDWIVRRINQSMKPASANTTVIGVLDIFGFEIFEKNSFEQLCINFTNEKLQQHFNQYTFKLEEALYMREEIKYEQIKFIDNQPVLDLIEKKNPQGIMLTMDEQLWVPKGSDETFIIACNKTHGNRQHANYAEVRTSKIQFMVKHYAGDVIYDATGFLDKNRDTLQRDLMVVVESTSNKFISTLFPPVADADRRTSKMTLGIQFRRQLEDLMTALNATEPHFIRAIKPNMEKVPGKFHGSLSLQQLRYAGVFEAVKIRQTGYPFRYTHADFLQRYAILNREIAKNTSRDVKSRCEMLIKAQKGNFSEVQIGKTRVLYRANSHRSFELLRNIAIEKLCILIQKNYRRFFAQKALKRILALVPILKEALQSRDIDKLKSAIDKAKDIDFKIRLTEECEKLHKFLVKEKEINTKLDELIGGEKGQGQQMAAWEPLFDTLSKLTSEAEELKIESPLITRAKEIVKFIKGKKECLQKLEEATKTSNKAILLEAIGKANELGLRTDEPLLVSAQAELARIEKEEELLKNVESTMATGAATASTVAKEWDHSTISTTELQSAIDAASAFGIRTPSGVKLLNEARVLVDLRKTLAVEDWDGVRAALMKAAGMQFNNTEIQSANEEVASRAAGKEVLAKLAEATQAMDVDAMAYGIQQATTLQLVDSPEVTAASKLLQEINTAKAALKAALENPNSEDLELAVTVAKPYSILSEDVARAEQLCKAMTELEQHARVGLYYMERSIMEAVLSKALEMSITNDTIREIKEYLNLDITKFIQLQLKVANRLSDEARAIRLQIQLKEIFFAQFRSMFVLHDWKRLRDPDAFAKTKLFGRETLRKGMLSWTKEPIPTSLTLLDSPYVKQAVRLFKNIQGFMGDKALSYPNALAQDLLDQGLKTPEVRDEIYCQLIKQLTDNENHLSVEKGWYLMGMCLQTFPPSDDFVNYLELFLKEKGGFNNFIGMLHDTQYTAPKSHAPNVELLLPTLAHVYHPWIIVDAQTIIDPSAVPVDFRGWAGGGSPRRVATGIVEAVATYGTMRKDTALDPADWRKQALDQIGKPRGQTIFTLWKVEQGNSTPSPRSARRVEDSAVVDVGKPTIRLRATTAQSGGGTSPRVDIESPTERRRTARGTIREYSPIEASRPKAASVNLRMQTLRGERPSTPDMDSQATLRRFNNENVKRVLVMYDYDGGGDPKKLQIYRGGVITVLKEYTGWGLGELDGKQGLYPLNYVKPMN